MATIKKRTTSTTSPSRPLDETYTHDTPTSIQEVWQFLASQNEDRIEKSLKDQQAILSKFMEGRIKKASQDIDKNFESKIKDALSTAQTNFKQETESSKVSVIETLAVFVALFTFVSTNITIFSKIEYLSAAIWFMLLMLISLLAFLAVLHILLHKIHEVRSWLVPLALILLLMLLLFLGMTSNKLNPIINSLSNDTALLSHEQPSVLTVPNVPIK